MKTLLPIREMEKALRRRDSTYDGLFITGIRTTGVFCRPSCPARAALSRNREFFPSPHEALAAGYRPCKRCRPMDANGRPPDWVRRLLAVVDRTPQVRFRDADVRALGIDPARARRYFLKHYGMTFQGYSRRRRMGQALKQIREGAPLDEVTLGNGYDSHSGFRDAFRRIFGQAPGHCREADCIVASWLESPLGPLVVGATAAGVCLLEFTDRRALETQLLTLRQRFGCAIVPGSNEHLRQLERELAEYFAGQRTEFTVSLDYPGTPFQRAAWNELRRIPYGHTRSYEEQAQIMGFPGAQRAAGRANGQNRIAIVIPCHRVVNKGGKLGGYGGGLWRKQFLLDLERRVLQQAATRGPASVHPKN
jgi:AraC family transcriptional regulator of adaptative response/methylated-DNA-[protein]-cysteine methyltransferase